MDEMKQTYIEEANELLANLETALLSLEENPNDKTDIEEVFRVMHTLKGNSSMFGLSVIADFVHDLESIYDKIRVGEMALSKELLDCTLEALDHLRVIVYDSDLAEVVNKDNHSRLIKTITQFIGANDNDTVKTTSLIESSKSQTNTYHIYFQPHENIFDDGSNPLFLLAELAEMGSSRIIPHFIAAESIEKFDPTKCNCYWDVYLETDQDEKAIMDVFVFVEGNSVIEVNKIPCINILGNTAFNDAITANINKDVKTDITSIIALAESVGLKSDSVVDKKQKSEPVAENGDAKRASAKEHAVSSIRVASDKLDELMNLVSELVTTQAGLTLFSETNKIVELEAISENVEKLSRRLRDIAFGMTLIPINNMFGRFQRMVRDVSKQLNKEIEFVTEGGETEMDKTIIETLTDPLMHILRNSLDHGIETGDERVKNGKPRQGKLTLKAYYSGVFVYIQIIDDGKGIDPEIIRAKAISKGIIKEEDILSETEIFDLIFYPGFSTAQEVTDVSGRGVGMDVVKRNVSDLKGSIAVKSKVNEGTTLTIRLPLTLSIIDGLLVEVGEVKYVIPLSVVNKCYEVPYKEMQDNFNKLLILDGEQIPFINLREEFNYSGETTQLSQVIVVTNGHRNVGMATDHIIGEYQAVIKPVGKHYKNQDFISGATILGDGSIALVLDTNKIIDQISISSQLEEKI